ncbi:hypothetical protein ACWGJ2_05320 [Streptomyces sp. NPDC054796]
MRARYQLPEAPTSAARRTAPPHRRGRALARAAALACAGTAVAALVCPTALAGPRPGPPPQGPAAGGDVPRAEVPVRFRDGKGLVALGQEVRAKLGTQAVAVTKSRADVSERAGADLVRGGGAELPVDERSHLAVGGGRIKGGVVAYGSGLTFAGAGAGTRVTLGGLQTDLDTRTVTGRIDGKPAYLGRFKSEGDKGDTRVTRDGSVRFRGALVLSDNAASELSAALGVPALSGGDVLLTVATTASLDVTEEARTALHP